MGKKANGPIVTNAEREIGCCAPQKIIDGSNGVRFQKLQASNHIPQVACVASVILQSIDIKHKQLTGRSVVALEPQPV